jgi:hypothetical protein
MYALSKGPAENENVKIQRRALGEEPKELYLQFLKMPSIQGRALK